MYGIINKALQDMVTDSHGHSLWEAVKEKSQIEIDFFLSQQMYPDEVTHQLVAAVSDIVQTPPNLIYFSLGEWWIVRTLGENYSGLLEVGGKTLKEFLINLPVFYNSVKRLYSTNKPVEFVISDIQENSLQVRYHCKNAGLEEITRGSLSGLGKLYQANATVILIADNSDNDTHVTYKVSW